MEVKMFHLILFCMYGFFVGIIAKILHPGADPIGFIPTVGIGIAGSYIGGTLHWLLGFGGSFVAPSGILFGVIGGVIFCYIYSYLMSQKNG